MDSTTLAAAITNYWSKTYGSPESNEQPSPQLYTFDGIKRHIKKSTIESLCTHLVNQVGMELERSRQGCL